MWGQIAGSALSIGGGLVSGRKASKAAAAAAEARRQQANQYWDSARFRPIGMTNRFGTSSFTQDANGNMTNAGYELDPEMAAYQDQLMGQADYGMDYATQTNNQVQGLFGLGQQYMAQDPQQAAANWMSKQQNLLAPMRERQLAGVRNSLFNSGRGGLAVGSTGMRPDGSGGLQASNPEMEAYYNALAQQDAQLATQADQFGMDQVNFGVGLFGKGQQLQANALNPFNNAMTGVTKLEELGMKPYEMSLGLGKLQSDINGNARLNYANMMNGATALQQQANSYSPLGTALSGAGSAVSGMNWGGGGGGFMDTLLRNTGNGMPIGYR